MIDDNPTLNFSCDDQGPYIALDYHCIFWPEATSKQHAK